MKNVYLKNKSSFINVYDFLNFLKNIPDRVSLSKFS